MSNEVDISFLVTARATCRATWPHVRALLILVHLVSIVILSLPSSARLGDKSHWDAPRQQDELHAWADRLSVEKQEFETFLWDTTQKYIAARRWISQPFLRYADYSGSRQGWNMFSNPRLITGRFDIEVEIDGEWELVFRPRDSEADWNRWQFDHNRVRKLLGRLATNSHQPAYNEFTNWVARRLAVDFPHATRAKIILLTWKTLGPGAIRDGKMPQENQGQHQEFLLEKLR